jgi:hypothetical protein
MKIGKLFLPCFMLLACLAPSLKAQDGLGGLGLAYLYGYGYGGFNSFATRSYNANVPYFSLHPPVYYGKRYARPYGASPFAAWPQLQANADYRPAAAASWHTPHAACCGAVITNPYAPAEVVPGPAAEHEAGSFRQKPVEPLVIENPYFDSAVQYTKAQVN